MQLASFHASMQAGKLLRSFGACSRKLSSSSSSQFAHVDGGTPLMVNVGNKSANRRTAEASCRLLVSQQLHSALLSSSGRLAKGCVVTTSELAGVMATKRTPSLIPLCHPLQLSSAIAKVSIGSQLPEISVTCSVECHGRTGVEMEAMTGCSIAALTVYDMCKSIDKSIIITELKLVSKTGGKSGDFSADAASTGN